MWLEQGEVGFEHGLPVILVGLEENWDGVAFGMLISLRPGDVDEAVCLGRMDVEVLLANVVGVATAKESEEAEIKEDKVP